MTDTLLAEIEKTVRGDLAPFADPNTEIVVIASLVQLVEIILQRFSLTRRIHCWDASFSRSFTPGGEVEYHFRLGIRDQKEIYLERGTRVQSFGGIQ